MNMAGKWAASTKTGPNDHSTVVWAISEFFFIISMYPYTY